MDVLPNWVYAKGVVVFGGNENLHHTQHIGVLTYVCDVLTFEFDALATRISLVLAASIVCIMCSVATVVRGLFAISLSSPQYVAPNN